MATAMSGPRRVAKQAIAPSPARDSSTLRRDGLLSVKQLTRALRRGCGPAGTQQVRLHSHSHDKCQVCTCVGDISPATVVQTSTPSFCNALIETSHPQAINRDSDNVEAHKNLQHAGEHEAHFSRGCFFLTQWSYNLAHSCYLFNVVVQTCTLYVAFVQEK